MIDLPFNKWSLRFHSKEYEAQYEEHSNKIRVLCFRIICFFICLAALASLIIFVAEEQEAYLVILVTSLIGISFLLCLFSHKLQGFMRYIFSVLLIVGTATYILVSLSDIEIPYGILGFSVGCSIMGIIQYSDNRLKLVYIISTSSLLLAIFDVFKFSTIHLVVYTYTSMIFVGSLAYMNEYTSRLAFSLNIIADKQKDLINEFVQDAIFAISLNERTSQFVLEFQNKVFEKQFNVKETEQMKIFLRSSFFTTKTPSRVSKNTETRISRKISNLEEYLFDEIKKENFSETETLPDICYITQNSRQQQIIQKMQMQSKLINYGKPLLLLIIKSDQVPQLIENYQSTIKYYQQSIINQSKSLAALAVDMHYETRKITVNLAEKNKFRQIQCLNFSMLNKIRNNITYFQKEKIYDNTKSIVSCQFADYIQTLENYCINMAHHYHKGFKLINQTDQDFIIRLNNQYLTQIVINLFEWALKQSASRQLIMLQVTEEQNLNPLMSRDNSIFIRESIEPGVEYSDSNRNQQIRLLSFCLTFYTDKEINSNQASYNQLYGEICNIQEQNMEIQQEVTRILLGLLGPYKGSYFISTMNPDSGVEYVNKIRFYIYSDQTMLDKSYVQLIHSQSK